jgi:hypothetical protein
MKNIHILRTDKPTRLHWYGDGFFGLYITNDERVNELDYYIKGDEPILAVWVPVSSECKKVIMTTDQELIKDGVQAIDDKFLEWFIKNPSCESVEVADLWKDGNPSTHFSYQIIIPQEELNLNCFDCNKSLQDCTCIEDTIDMKQETLEEAASRLLYSKYPYHPPRDSGYWKDMFISGANYQAEKMYSEEEMKLSYKTGARLALISQSDLALCKGKFPTPDEWFNEFKKT